jgi:hypothetical protein
MDNQHKKIKGYRELSQYEIDLMNEIKAKAEEVGELVSKLQFSLSLAEAYGAGEEKRPDQRWVSIGKTHLQEGFMALVRSVAKPESF